MYIHNVYNVIKLNCSRYCVGFGHELRAGRLEGLQFRRQMPIDRYIADFACPTHKLIIEVDGSQRTSHPRMFAAGDITADPMRAIVASASEAAKAALAIAKELGAYTLTQEELDEFFTELS